MAESELPESGQLTELPTEAAFRACLAEMAAQEEGDLLAINVDVTLAVTTVLGSLPALRALRPEIVLHLPTFDLKRFDRLEQYAIALMHAHGLHRGSLARRSSITALGAELTQLRDRLLGDAQALANHGLLNGEPLRACKKQPGYRALASDVLLLLALFRQHWPQIAGRTPASPASLQRAGNAAVELLRAIGEKALAPVPVSETQLARQRAYTVFFRAYDDARHAVEFLRRAHGDAREIAPAFHVGRGGRNGAAASKDAEAAEAPAAGVPAPEAAPKPASDASPAFVFRNPHNLPVSSPFVQ